MYVCTVCKKNYVRAEKKQPYSIDCHRGVMGMYHCALENMTDFSFAHVFTKLLRVCRGL